MESKFTFKYLFTKLKAVTILVWKSFELGLFTIILVTLANNIGTVLSFTVLGKSLTYLRNSRGPKTSPWGTPSVIFSHAEKLVWFSPTSEIWLWYVIYGVTATLLTLKYDASISVSEIKEVSLMWTLDLHNKHSMCVCVCVCVLILMCGM